jgi:L-lactate utilization protein LutB
VVDSETGGPYESEIEMLRKVLDRIELERDKAFVADRGYDAVDIIQKILNKGLKSAIKVKETVRMRIRNPSR